MAATTQPSLPEGFLDGPAPNPKVSRVNFSKTSVPEYKDMYAVVLDGVMSQQECDALIGAAESHAGEAGWERAMINVGGGEQMLATDARNCGRIMWDSPEVAAKLWARINEHVPELHSLNKWPLVTGNGPAKRNEVLKLTRLNERLRFLKYTSGEYFRPHCDGAYETPDGKERSYFTLHLYLNDAEEEGGIKRTWQDVIDLSMPEAKKKRAADAADSTKPLKGGATTFHSCNMKKRFDVDPKAGRVLLFQHRFLIHSGDDVVQGTKLTMRTDIMYEREAQQ